MKQNTIKRLKVYAAIGILSTGCGYLSYRCVMTYIPPKDNAIIKPISDSEDYSIRCEFDAGEHIIAEEIHLKKNNRDIIQLEYHDGYQIKGMNIDLDTSYILYENDETIIANSTGYDSNNNPIFADYGKPIDNNKHNNINNGIIKAGQHILAVPISKPDEEELQIEYHEGYEVVDIAAYTYGRFLLYGGGYIIYVNTTDIKCNDKTNCFGTPIDHNHNKINALNLKK